MAYGTDVSTIRREIFALDSGIEAEIPDYEGPRLDTQTRKVVAMVKIKELESILETV